MDYQRDEHRVHLVVFHLVWTPKRRGHRLRALTQAEVRPHVVREAAGL
ncbi:MAG: hypothetical protein WC516_04455 [Patescibacteria group bacterium]